MSWKLWARTLGPKISDDPKEADIGAMLRTIWTILQVITCLFIIAGVIRHW